MSRLIDADEITYEEWECGDITLYITNKESIDALTTVDAVPVVHGRWIDEGQYGDNFPHHAWRCSECGEHVIEIDTSWYKYCPNCGARMDKE